MTTAVQINELYQDFISKIYKKIRRQRKLTKNCYRLLSRSPLCAVVAERDTVDLFFSQIKKIVTVKNTKLLYLNYFN